MTAYYNEIDPFAAAWIRELIKAGLIAPGEVDERSIEEVTPDDLRGFTQCHFFAGIGVWSYALRNAGWSDVRPVWTGSCPCPSFSAAGQGKGFEDPRHLWPCWFGLIRESRPATIFGEQADKAIGFGWLDLVQTDLEAEGYAVGATVFGAHSVGAPHIRQRLYFVADSQIYRTSGDAETWKPNPKRSSTVSGRADANLRRSQKGRTTGSFSRRDARHEDLRSATPELCDSSNGSDSDGGHASAERLQRSRQHGLLTEDREPCEHSDPTKPRSARRQDRSADRSDAPTLRSGSVEFERSSETRNVREWRGPGWLDPITARSVTETGATRGFWADCDWWYGRDGKYRPIGAGLFPLVAGATGRMGKLRGYGNALCAPQAQAFIEAYMSVRGLK